MNDDDDAPWVPTQDDGIANTMERWRAARVAQTIAGSGSGALASFGGGGTGEVALPPHEVLLKADILVFGDKTSEGQLVEAVAIPFWSLLDELKRDPEFMFKIPPRKMEEFIAGSYEQRGWSVILTPRSGDGGRDVIATRDDVGRIRIFDEVKAYAPGNPVPATDVRAMLGVLTAKGNVSKGVVTTTSTFAPGIYNDSDLTRLMPNRLQLIDGNELLDLMLKLRNVNGTR